MGGIKNSLVIVIAIVERSPKCELPGPACIYSVILSLGSLIPYLTTSMFPFFRVGGKKNSRISCFFKLFLVEVLQCGNKKIWKFILEMCIRKKIDKKLEKFAKPFQTTNLIGKKKKKNPEHNVMCCGAKFELKSAWKLCNENTHRQPNCHPRLT